MKKIALVCHRNAKLSFIFEAAQAAGIELVQIFDDNEAAPAPLPAVSSTWQLPVFKAPEEALTRFAAEADARGIGGIITLREEAVIWTAKAAARMGFPGISPDVAAVVRDKYKMRQAFSRAGLKSPGYRLVTSPDDLSSLDDLTLPLVIKPLSGWSSTGVMLAHDRDELNALVASVWAVQTQDLAPFSDADAPPGLVVEEYLSGKEFVVECFVDRDGVHVMAVGDKGQPTGPWFEETIYRQRSDIDNPLIVAICDTARAGVKAVGITTGPAHVELRLDAHDVPHLIEIGARIGGSGVSHFIVEQGTGISFGRLCLLSALGQPTESLPAVLPTPNVAANYIIPLNGNGHFQGFSGLDAVERHADTARTVIFFEPRHFSPAPPAFGGYPGFIFSVHATSEDAAAYHAFLDETLRIDWAV